MFTNTCKNTLFPFSILKLEKTRFADQFVPIFRIIVVGLPAESETSLFIAASKLFWGGSGLTNKSAV